MLAILIFSDPHKKGGMKNGILFSLSPKISLFSGERKAGGGDYGKDSEVTVHFSSSPHRTIVKPKLSPSPVLPFFRRVR